MVELDWIHIVIAIVATALATLGFSGLARKRGKRKAAAPLHPKPPPPEKTADEHSTELELVTADVVDEAAADYDVPVGDVAALIESADQLRSSE